MRFVACAYRDWALKVVVALRDLFPDHQVELARDPQELDGLLNGRKAPDAIIAIGWSWLFPKAVVEGAWVVGVHPSDLPDFAGGSPIQNQILAGITDTCARRRPDPR
jgi:methionyl-tRNA formyltransferase